MNQDILNRPLSPVAVGGVGGSGTRLVCNILQQLGYFMGSDLNDERDNLWFTLIFRRTTILREDSKSLRQLYRLFKIAMRSLRPLEHHEIELLNALCHDRGQTFDAQLLRLRVENMKLAAKSIGSQPCAQWGWKEPNSHIVIGSLWEFEPSLRYIHVYRNGLDMAFSDNQNQPVLWSRPLFGISDKNTPRSSLTYWCKAHRRMVELSETKPDRFFFLNYDEICEAPIKVLKELYRFLDVYRTDEQIVQDASLVRPSSSIGRFKLNDLSQFDHRDLEYIQSLGVRL